MNGLLISAYEWLVCLSESVMVFLLFNSRFGIKNNRRVLLYAAIPSMATVTFVMNLLSAPWAMVSAIGILLYFIYGVLCFDGSLTLKFIWSPVPSVILCISNYVCLIILYLITDWGGEGLIPGNTVRIFGQLFYMALNFVLLLPLLKLKNTDGELPGLLRAGALLLALIGVAVSMYCFSLIVAPEAEGVAASSWIPCAAVLFLSIALIVLSEYLSRIYSRHLETQKDLQKTKLEAEHVSQVGAMYEYVREWRHDIKGMVSTVTGLAERGEYESMRNYLRELNGAADETKLLISTGNPALDATVSAKLMLADKNGINVEHTISVPENMPIDSIDICSVIMNLMDNAIDAVSKQTSAERLIELGIIDKGGMLSINVKNPCSGDYKFDGESLSTTKEDSSVHGIGLKRVNRIVSAYGGFIKIEPKEHSFEVSILLPLDKEATN